MKMGSAGNEKSTFQEKMKEIGEQERTIVERMEQGIQNIKIHKPDLSESEMYVIQWIFNQENVRLDGLRTKKMRLVRHEFLFQLKQRLAELELNERTREAFKWVSLLA